MSSLRLTLRFYLPFLLSILLVGAGLLLEFSDSDLLSPTFEVSFLGLTINLPMPARYRSEIFARLLICSAGVLFLGFALSANFASYFPARLRMDVFFDQEGLEDSLLAFFRTQDSASLHLDAAWKEHIERYDSVVKEALREILRSEGADESAASAVDRNNMHAHGETSFVVGRVSPVRYRICESDGYLEHRVDAPGNPSFGFRTEFSLRATAHDHLRVRLSDLLRGGHLLRPEFKQIFRVKGFESAKTIDHIVIGATRVRILPLPWVGRTIYLWRDEERNVVVPIAYAVYY